MHDYYYLLFSEGTEPKVAVDSHGFIENIVVTVSEDAVNKFFTSRLDYVFIPAMGSPVVIHPPPHRSTLVLAQHNRGRHRSPSNNWVSGWGHS